jgi:hypothetical protein
MVQIHTHYGLEEIGNSRRIREDEWAQSALEDLGIRHRVRSKLAKVFARDYCALTMSDITKAIRRAENPELPLLALGGIKELRVVLDELEHRHVVSAREKGASWGDIAASMGISRQALQYRMRAREE